MKYDELNIRQQNFIRNLYDGMVREADAGGVEIFDTYPRQWLKMMSVKYCEMNWAPAWIVKDKSRQAGKGRYTIPELLEYHNMCLRYDLPADDGETIIIGTEVVTA